MAEVDGSETVDVDGQALGEAREERERLLGVVLKKPALPASRVGARFEQRALCVSAHEESSDRKAVDEGDGLLGQGPPGQISAENREIGRELMQLGQDRLERDCVAMDVGEDGDTAGGDRS